MIAQLLGEVPPPASGASASAAVADQRAHDVDDGMDGMDGIHDRDVGTDGEVIDGTTTCSATLDDDDGAEPTDVARAVDAQDVSATDEDEDKAVATAQVPAAHVDTDAASDDAQDVPANEDIINIDAGTAQDPPVAPADAVAADARDVPTPIPNAPNTNNDGVVADADEHEPSYAYDRRSHPNMNYYPTYPEGNIAVSRYDSNMYGAATSDEDESELEVMTGDSSAGGDDMDVDRSRLESEDMDSLGGVEDRMDKASPGLRLTSSLEEGADADEGGVGREARPPRPLSAKPATFSSLFSDLPVEEASFDAEPEPKILQNLPQTYKPFQANKGRAKKYFPDEDKFVRKGSGNSDGSGPSAEGMGGLDVVKKNIQGKGKKSKNGKKQPGKKQPPTEDLGYISTQPFHGDEYESYSPVGSTAFGTTSTKKKGSYAAARSAKKPSKGSDVFAPSSYFSRPREVELDDNGGNRPATSRGLKSAPVARVSRRTYNSLPPIPLHALPIDALHAASSYCEPKDWASLAACNRVWRGIGREVFGKVWRHAGRCVVEVGVAWARGEHADARELASLYISKGVPIYPTPHGHSYHTIAWRMGLELEAANPAAENEDEGGGEGNAGAGANGNANANAGRRGGANANNNAGGNANRDQRGAAGGNANAPAAGGNENGEDDQNEPSATDAFYTDRYVENRPDQQRDSLFSRNHTTYVEEKAVFWKQKKGIEVSQPPQARGGLFPFSLGNGNNNVARGPPAVPPPPPAAPQAAEMGAGGPAPFNGAAAGGVAAGGIGMARPPPLPLSVAPGMAATMPVAGLAPPFGGPVGARPQSAVPGPRPPLMNVDASMANAAATLMSDAAAARAASAGPRYVRRSSFSGAQAGSPLSALRNSSAPDLLTLQDAAAAASAASTASSAAAAARAPHPVAPGPHSGDRHTHTLAPTAPKMTMRIHRHLADQHFFGSPAVNDENGTMSAGKMSMNADFFHPTWEGRHNVAAGFGAVGSLNNQVDNWDGYWEEQARGQMWRTGNDGADYNTTNNAGTVPPVGGTTMAAAMGAAAIDEGAVAEVAPAANGGAANNAGEANVNDIGETVDQEGADAINDPNPRMMDNNYRAAVRAFVSWTLANADRQRRNSLPNAAGGTRHPMSLAPSLWSRAQAAQDPVVSPASDVHLEVYSSSSASLKSDDEDDSSEAVARMRSLCARYQDRLDSMLTSGATFDTASFQEALLDFWDELFPATQGIHFYNQQSPVPRMSKLHAFLTTPCPKAIGTVQCEIERVKVSGKNSKGAKRVKGRFFPSYEYRLFIRDTKNDNSYQSINSRSRHPPRRDSVLLVAKNKSKGRNSNNSGGGSRGSGVGGIDFATPAALASPSNGTGGSSKRGVTNYYMCLPQQKDVDSHFKSANRNNSNAALAAGETSGLAVSPMAIQSKDMPVEVGRLQSNFIGTEFQIFAPTKTVSNNRRDTQSEDQRSTNASEEGGSQGDSRVHPIETAVSTPNNATSGRRTSRRGSGLVRLARRASGHLTRRGSLGRSSDAGNDPVEDSEPPPRRGKKAIRRMSWGSSNIAKSRRAIANNSESYDGDYVQSLSSSSTHPNAGLSEIENGAITYTANLLGNRPRIMDVCIPKLNEEGVVCDEWSGERQEGAAAAIVSGNGTNGGSATTMLDRFKTIQQGLDNIEEGVAPGNNNNNNNRNNNGNADSTNGGDDHGLMVLQNRPPWWNIELGAFVLNFGGRVKVASVKNFQLCERNDRDHVMQFGRIEGRHAFTMDFQHPLTPMQAFAIAISSLQSKISFG